MPPLIWIALTLTVVAAQSAPIEIVLPQDVVQLNQCQVHYLLTGPFGGVRSFVPASTFTDRVIHIPVEHEGIAAEHLKTLVWCPRRNVWTMDIDLTRETPRRLAARLTGIGYLGVYGIVAGWAAPEESLRVHVDYEPPWICSFFRLADCAYSPWPVFDAQVTQVGPDGSFVALLPDFARDGVIGATGMAGEFRFSLQDEKGSRRFALRPAGASGNQWSIPVQGTYSELRFTLEPPR